MQNISIFVSSTFNDMMNERDILVRYVMPELSEYFNPKGIDIHLIDLRWGVVTEDETDISKEKKILKCCVDTIDICKPFFIGFIGHKYGWIPDEENNSLSVTHIEIEQGIIKNNNYEKSLIFIRDKKSYAALPKEQYNKYIDEDIKLVQYATTRVHKLQEGYKIANSKDNIIPYSLNVINPSVDEVYELTQLIFINLKRVIEKEININPNFSVIHPCELYLKNYIPPIEQYTSIISNINRNKHSVIYGEQGVGKTSFGVYLYYQLKQQDCNINSFMYSPDILINNSIDVKSVIQEWSEEMSGTKLQPLENVAGEWKRFKYINNKQQKKTVIILDSYDKIKEIKDSNLFFVPTNGIIFIVLSTTNLVNWEFRYNIKAINIHNFTENEACKLINKAILTTNKKNIPRYVYDAILKFRKNNNGGYNPMDLSVLTSYILSLDKNDFEKINQTEGDNKEKALYDYIATVIKELPKERTLRSLYILEKISKIFGKDKIKQLVFLAHSLYGLSDYHLKKLKIGYDAISFFLIRNYIKPYIGSIQNNGKWNLLDSSMVEAIKSLLHIDSQEVYNTLSKLDKIPQEESFYYALWGYNKEKIYGLYSLKEESHGKTSWYNQYLLKFFEVDENQKWFLSIFRERDIESNEIILSNLIFSFYSHSARQNYNINVLSFLNKILSKVKDDTIKLGNHKLYYLGVLSECIGRELMNRTFENAKINQGLIYLNEALNYYKSMENGDTMVQNITDYIKSKVQ